jgi:LmbE family N-acetylglucosaminyl deacetylase
MASAFKLKRLFPSCLLLAGLAAAPASSQPLPWEQGATGLALALRRLSTTARVLYVTAHPDDEHNGFLVRLARGQGVRTALLTLTRGDGGQNAIGPELFEALGVLRSEELMAAHRYDGALQYFGRPYEFGYSFSVEETFARWGREASLADVVRVVRAFRPDVILSLPLEAPGGGQHHQAAAQLAREAFRASADPERFPEQRQAGLRPWQARTLYQTTGVGGDPDRGVSPAAAELRVPVGVYDPVLGMTWQQLGAIGRSRHRSQGAVQVGPGPGPAELVLSLVDSEPALAGPLGDVFDGVDVSLRGLLRFASGDTAAQARLSVGLEALTAQVQTAHDAFDLRAAGRARPHLAAALGRLRALRDLAAASLLAEPGRAELLDRLASEEQELEAALTLAQALVVEALADDDLVEPGQAFGVSVTLWNQGDAAVEAADVALDVPKDWSAARQEGEAGAVAAGASRRFRYTVSVAANARASQPYWRRRPAADRYDLDVPEHESLPWSPPDVVARVRYQADGAEARCEVPAVVRYPGRLVGGERQKLVKVVPALSLRLAPEVAVFPQGAGGRPTREFRVVLVSSAKRAVEPVVRLRAPAGFRVEPAEARVRLGGEGEQATLRFRLEAPAQLGAGTARIEAVASLADKEYREGVQAIAYDHVEERHLLRPAAATALFLPVRVARGASVGYVEGVGDEVPEAIRQLGLPLRLLGEEDLTAGDLTRLSTIVLGIRAYFARADLRSSHERLMRWVEQGGNLVVQYQRSEFNPGSADAPSPYAPYPARVSTRRVTD